MVFTDLRISGHVSGVEVDGSHLVFYKQYYNIALVLCSKNGEMGDMVNTHAVHPADVGRDTGKDSGLSVGVAARGRHKAGHTVDDPLATNVAVQRATRVALKTTTNKSLD